MIGAHQLYHTFPDLPKYGFYTSHPNFTRMGHFWGTYTVLKYPVSTNIQINIYKNLKTLSINNLIFQVW